MRRFVNLSTYVQSKRDYGSIFSKELDARVSIGLIYQSGADCVGMIFVYMVVVDIVFVGMDFIGVDFVGVDLVSEKIGTRGLCAIIEYFNFCLKPG